MIRLFYPWYTFSVASFKSAQLPFWNPYIFSGNPHLANFQSAIFYPLNWLYLFLPQLSVWSILIIIQPLLAATFCYLFLTSFPIKKIAACFGAFAFSFSGYIFTWSQEAIAVGHSVLWLPLILYGFEKRRYLIVTLGITFSLLAGYLQTTIYVCVLALAYALFRRVPITKIILVFLLAAGLSAIQLVPSLESFSLSARPTASIETVFDTYLLPVDHLIKLIAPDINGNPAVYNYFGKGSYNETVLYIGFIPFAFAILAMWKKRGDKTVQFFTAAAVFSFLLTSTFPPTRWLLHLPLPLLPTFQPSRILILTTFALSALSAWGFSLWLEDKKKVKQALVVICLTFAGVLALTIGYYHFTFGPSYWQVAAKNCVLPLAILLLVPLLLRLRRFSLPAILLLTAVTQLYFVNKYVVLGDKQFLYPANPIYTLLKETGSLDRFLVFGQPIIGDYANIFKVFSPEGVDPIYSKRYGQLIYASRDLNQGKIVDDLPRTEISMSQLRATSSGELSETMSENWRRLRLMSLLGVKTVFYSQEPSLFPPEIMFPQTLFQPQTNLGKWLVFNYPEALPRTFLAPNTIKEQDPQKIADKIFDPNFDLSKTLILEENSPPTSAGNYATAKFISYQPDAVEIETDTDQPKLLFLSDNYYPGWKAKVDNVETKIYRADFTFRAVFVPAGKHLIKFSYEPLSFKIGVSITLGVLLLLFVQSQHLGDRLGWKLGRQQEIS